MFTTEKFTVLNGKRQIGNDPIRPNRSIRWFAKSHWDGQESKVDRIDNNTKGLVEAIDAAQGAIKVLSWIASIAKPILYVGGLIMAAGAIWQTWIKK